MSDHLFDPGPPPIETWCQSCRYAEERDPPPHGGRWVHRCESGHGEPCACPECNPPGSFRLDGRVTVEIDVTCDLAAMIRRHPDVYRQFAETGRGQGYADWEVPVAWLSGEIAEDQRVPSLPLGVTDLYGVDPESEFGSWTPERYEALCAVCPEARVP